MAAGDLALPVGHVPAAQATLSTVRVAIGRPFRQPLALPDSSNFSSGLELWLHSDPADRALFAVFDGYLQFVSAPAAGQPDQLRLGLTLETLQRYRDIRAALEPPPQKIIYENVDRAGVEAAIRSLITNAYNASRTTLHPILGASWRQTRLKFRLDSVGGDIAAEVNDFVSAFIADPQTRVRVNAGDRIGDAATPLATDPSPANLPFATSARRVTVFAEEYAANRLNPAYYLWNMLKDAHETPATRRRVNVVSHCPAKADHSFDHPLLAALALRLDQPVLPRVLTQVQLPNVANPSNALLFPVGWQSDWHTEKWGAGASTIHWRMTNDANLEFQTQHRPGAPQPQQDCPIDVTNPPQLYTNRMQAVWLGWGEHLNRICTALQIPVEIIAATIGQEGGANDPRALALEYLRGPGNPRQAGLTAADFAVGPEIARLQAAGVDQTIIDRYVDLTVVQQADGTFRTGRYGLSVPNPWNGAAQIDVARSQLTYDELLEIIDVVPERMSPGLIQTLVVNGEALYFWIAERFSDIQATFRVADPLAAGPARYRDWFSWLLTGEHAILAGSAYHKRSYVQQLGALDLPRMGSLYNSGNVQVRVDAAPIIKAVFPALNDSQWLKDPQRPLPPTCPAVPANQDPRNPWRLRYHDLTYARNLGRFYNALQRYFQNGALGSQVPVVRFWASL